jgi:hypothetical protein
MLDELNDAGNELNVVVLDACRDNPFPWSRSTSRGLQVVGHQPADSIIVYATSAGSTAQDGTGRNGLFTAHLLDNLKQPGLEVTEVFRRTMGDVARASGNQQRPAVYNQFAGIAYLGSSPSQPSPTPNQTYKIGDRGPAGGIVFYDKGNNSGGWRYLEAAPVETEKQMHWAGWYDGFDEKYHDSYTYKGFTHQASGTGTGIGNGKRNTQLIIDNLRHYDLWLPVHYCSELMYGGFNDWFLPSKDELNLMYRNLAIKGLGDFSTGEYWSSSEPVAGNLAYVNSGTWIQVFENGKQEIGPLGEAMPYIRVRAIRSF